jgi:hypothetical protein
MNVDRRVALFVIVVVLASCTASVVPSPTAPPTAAPPAFDIASAGLLVDVPAGWDAQIAPVPSPLRAFNHVSFRKGPVVVYLTSLFGGPTDPLNGALPPDPFPLDWSNARATPFDPRAQVLDVPYLGQPLILRAEMAASPDALVLRELVTLVGSIRPEPIPDHGTFRNWIVAGRADAFTVGSVTTLPHDAASTSPAPAVTAVYLVRGAHGFRALLDSVDDGDVQCTVRYDAALKQFACENNGAARWSKFGLRLDVARSLGLAHYEVQVIAGTVLIGGATLGGGLTRDP